MTNRFSRPHPRLRALLPLLAGLLLCGFRAPLEGAYDGVGTVAPDLSLTDLQGRDHDLSELALGWTLVKFGTTWCGRCDDQTRELNDLAAFLEAEKVSVVEVYVREEPGDVRSDVEREARVFASRIALDGRGESILLYHLRVIPRMFLVDPQGVVRLDAPYTESAKLRGRLREALHVH